MEGADGVGRQLGDVHQENLHHPVGLGPTVRPVLVTLDLHREKTWSLQEQFVFQVYPAYILPPQFKLN